MRTRELVAVLALAAMTTACVDNPDPRHPTLQKMQMEGVGSWIVATARDGVTVEGELISATQEYVHILRVGQKGAPLVFLRSGDIAEAKLYKYESEGGIGGIGLLGTLSTISHGFFLVFTAPIWMITAGVAAGYESKHVLLEYPEVSLEELSDWARFPQGIPPTVDEEALLVPRANRRKRPAPITQPVGPPPVTPPVGPAPISPPSETPPKPAASNPAAMFMDAKAAAARNDCVLVLELSGKVQLADQTYYDAVFSKDPSIRRCLGL